MASLVHICDYGNCQETDTPIYVKGPSVGARRYCSQLHAAASLLRWGHVKSGYQEYTSEPAAIEALGKQENA
jgi:hypothetical protein